MTTPLLPPCYESVCCGQLGRLWPSLSCSPPLLPSIASNKSSVVLYSWHRRVCRIMSQARSITTSSYIRPYVAKHSKSRHYSGRTQPAARPSWLIMVYVTQNMQLIYGCRLRCRRSKRIYRGESCRLRRRKGNVLASWSSIVDVK